MKISPIAAPAPVDTQAPQALSTRSIKMNVNRTPGQEYAPPEESAPTNPNVAIPDGDNQAQGEIEANEPLSPQMAVLAKQRRALQVKERELAEREKKLSETSSSGVDVSRIKADPLGVLLEAGVTYDQLTEAVIANQGSPEVLKLQQKLKEMEEKLDGKLQDRDQQAEKVHFALKTKEAERLIAQGDTYQMVRDTGSLPLVIQYMQREYKENGEVVDLDEALGLFEEELLERGTKLASLEKVKGKLQPEQPQPPTPKPRPPTLTNRDNAQVPMSRKQRALAAFNGTLNK